MTENKNGYEDKNDSSCPRFYVGLDGVLLEPENIVELSNEVHRHILVLRKKIGDGIILFNGDGNQHIAIILELHKKFTLVKIHQQLKTSCESSLDLELLLCVIANDKMDLAIQKAVELGVKSITPVLCQRSQRIYVDKISKRVEHWQKIIISSCEQCGRNIIPKINLPAKFADMVKISNMANQDVIDFASTNNDVGSGYDQIIECLRLIMLPRSQSFQLLLEQKFNQLKLKSVQQIKQLKLLVGPEGGFNMEEIKEALSEGFVPLHLGNTTLRSETAVIAGITFAQIQYGNFI
ncbi:MAG: rRNA (uracil1498-N3)-methyltransferase [Pseudomonadota bacterium]|nr:rRNA (uracil1498-N3)-methyltransferase [Pseudomonadota bacterium]